MKASLPNLLARTLHDFFSEYLPELRAMSPDTIQSYRDSLVLLLRFATSHLGRADASLEVEDLKAEEVITFLNYLEKERNNTAGTRNVRLAAVHAFFRYMGGQHPDLLEHAQRILAIPFKRVQLRTVEYLEFEEIEIVLSGVDRSKHSGRRDYALIATMFNTGARVSEAIGIRARDIQFARPCHIRLLGKGRKERLCPIFPETAEVLRALCMEKSIDERSEARVFVNHRGQPITRFGVRYILAKHFGRAQAKLAGLANKRLHPHSMRHSTAVHLLRAGVDLSSISHWLGHASPNTTNKYTSIDLDIKRKALARAKSLANHEGKDAPWRQDKSILEWLESL